MLKYRLAYAGLVLVTIACVVVTMAVARGGDASSSATASTPQHSSRGPISHPSEAGIRHESGIPVDAQRARVTRHVDGDTLHLFGEGNGRWLSAGEDTAVRLLEIDTPESVDPTSAEQCYAERASEALDRLLPIGAVAWVVGDRDLLDAYGRTLLYLWTADGRFVNLSMVQAGYAKAVLFEPNDRHIGVMRRAEVRAKAAKRGLWGACRYFGQPRGLLASPQAEQPREGNAGAGEKLDPRFPYCSDATAAGYGNYVRGRDPEYRWYDDADGDGVVCER